jgi:hypothetical protein
MNSHDYNTFILLLGLLPKLSPKGTREGLEVFCSTP